MILIKNLPIDQKEYFRELHKKTCIVLHHTVSGGSSDSVKEWWEGTPDRVATAYIIDKVGCIYNLFPDEYWSWHWGPGCGSVNNKRSIGIEIINEGPLVKKGDDFFWNEGRTLYKGPVHTLEQPWRDVKYFASYTKEQFESISYLCKILCKKYDIPPHVIHNYTFDKKYRDHIGIMSHHNIQSYKTDVSKAFDLPKLSRELNEI